jgi:hypothetical protein
MFSDILNFPRRVWVTFNSAYIRETHLERKGSQSISTMPGPQPNGRPQESSSTAVTEMLLLQKALNHAVDEFVRNPGPTSASREVIAATATKIIESVRDPVGEVIKLGFQVSALDS